MSDVHFWHVMHYRCDQGEFEVPVYLEEGCEGPRDQVIEGIVPEGHPYLEAGKRVPIRLTDSGRTVVPVPFVAGRCPEGHAMTHVDWARDYDLAPRLTLEALPAGTWTFRYPAELLSRRMDLWQEDGCGRLRVTT